MEPEQVISIRRGLRWVVTVSLVALAGLLPVAPGCASQGNGARGTAPNMQDIVAWADPTGITQMHKAIKEAADQTKSLLDALDVEELNAAVQYVRKVMHKLSERLDAIPPGDVQSASGDIAGSMKVVRAQLECIPLPQAVDSVQALADQINVKMKALDVEQANSLIAEAKESVADIRCQMDQLSEQLFRTNENLRYQLGKAGDQIEALPVQELREALVEFKGDIGLISGRFESVCASAQTALCAGTALFIIVSVCALAWLVKFVRSWSS